MFKLSIDDVREDLHFTMRVGSKALTRFNSIFIDDAERTELVVKRGWGVVSAEVRGGWLDEGELVRGY